MDSNGKKALLTVVGLVIAALAAIPTLLIKGCGG